MIQGIDALGLAKYPQIIKDELPTGWALGAFLNTFGSSHKYIEEILKLGRCPAVRVHSIFEGDHTYNSAKHDRIILKDFNWAKALKQKFPNVRIYFSPFCELTKGNLEPLLQRLEKLGLSGTELVQSTTFPIRTNRIAEVHGQFASPSPSARYIFSYDGQSAFGSDVESDKKRLQNSEIYFWWSCHLNLKYKDQPSKGEIFPPPLQRTYRPQNKHIDALIALSRVRGEVSIPSNWIVKPCADDHGKIDPKSNHLVIIAPQNVKELKLVAMSSNQVIDTCRNAGLFTDKKRYRYYGNDWGYLIAEKARRVCDDLRVRVFGNGKQLAVVTPAFRGGSYR